MGFMSILNDVGITKADIDRAVGANAEIRAAVMAKAKEVQAYWQSIAPVSEKEHVYNGHLDEPGDYRDSIRVRFNQKGNGFFTATVFTTDWKAHWLEYGSIHNPEFGFAQRTVDNFGGKSFKGSHEGYLVSS